MTVKALLYSVILCGTMLLLGCGSASKVSYTDAEIAAFTDFMATKSYKFVAQTANPTMSNGITAVANSGLWPPGGTFSNIQLQGNDDFLKVNGDSISADLPYFGERQMGGGYNSESGIVFNDIPSRYKEEYDTTKNEMRITFTISEMTESYRVTMNIFPTKKATLIINSAQRFPIRFLGELEDLEAAKD